MRTHALASAAYVLRGAGRGLHVVGRDVAAARVGEAALGLVAVRGVRCEV